MLCEPGSKSMPPVPAAVADDVYGGSLERIRVADDRPDVEVVLPVLDRDVKVAAM
jgi:hypothetical protein